MLPTDENSAIEIRPCDIPESMREDEVDQSEGEETIEEQFSELFSTDYIFNIQTVLYLLTG